MAKEDELELDVKATKQSGKGKLIMLLVAVILLISGSTIGVLYYMGMLGTGSSSKHATKAGAKNSHAVKPSYYLSLKPPFIVNFADQSHASYLQVEMQVMAHNHESLNLVKENMPLVRNNILLVLSAQKFEKVSTRAGKEALQKQILDTIQKVVETAEQQNSAGHGNQDKPAPGQPAAKPKNVAQVYFTSFIMQ